MATQDARLPENPGAGTAIARLSDEEHEVWRAMISVHARLVGRLDAELQAANGISLRDYEVLVQLSEVEGGALRMAELADLLIVSPSGLTRRLDGLVQDGLVERRACTSDRRGTLAVLSAAGQAVLEHAAPTHVAVVRRFLFDIFDHQQLEQWTSCLRLMSAALDDVDASSDAGASSEADDRARSVG